MERKTTQAAGERQGNRRRDLIAAAQSLLSAVAADPELPIPRIDLESTVDHARFHVDRLVKFENLTPAETAARIAALLTDVEQHIEPEDRLFPYRLTGRFGPLSVTVLSNLGVTVDAVDAACAELAEATAQAQPRKPEPPLTVWYQIEHTRSTDTDAAVSALRAESLDAYLYGFDFDEVDVTVTVHEDGVMVDRGDFCELVRPLETWGSVADYAAAIARIVRGEDEPAPVCPAPGCEVEVTVDRPWCGDACRAMDLAGAGGAR